MTLLNKMNIGKKLYSGFGLVLLFFIIAVVIGLFYLEKLDKASDTIETKYHSINAAEDLRSVNSELSLLFMGVIVDKTNNEISEERKNLLESLKKELTKEEKILKSSLLTESEQNYLKKIITNIKKLIKIGEEELFPAVLQQEIDETFWNNIDDTIDKSASETRELIKTVKSDLQEEIKKARENAVTTKHQIWIKLIGLLVVGCFLGILITFFIRRSILIPVKAIVERTGELAEGDVDMEKRLEVRTNDEIGKLAGLFNQFLNRLQDLVKKINSESSQLNKSTDRISEGSMELATRTSEQAASVTQTSTTVEEFASILRQSSEHSEETNTMLEKFNEEIEEKKGLITDVTATMTEISDSSKKIDNIVNVINDISFQTNLLALNAAVEAARAGEAGRGFAVVASEVRNLAQKTAESSKTIQEIVTQNVSSTQKGMELIKQTSDFFEAIIKIFGEIKDRIQMIAAGAREQSTGVDQINQAISQLEDGLNQNAALVDEFTSSSKSMKANSTELTDLMTHFKMNSKKVQSKPSKKIPPKISEKKGKESKPQKVESQQQKKKPAPDKPPKETVKKDTGKTDDVDDFFSAEEGGFDEF